MEEMALVPLGAPLGPIDLNALGSIAMVTQPTVVDADGARSATLLFRPQTGAVARLEDGNTIELTTLTVRAIEFTVGVFGPQAMPAPLPPTTAYTYCVELSVDEADELGASTVEFNRPVAFVLDNFINVPVGSVVPVGAWDRQRAAWLPSPEGRVVGVVSSISGALQLDIDGDGVVDDPSEMAAIGLGVDERIALASRFVVGDTFWVAELSHFTPYDLNYPLDQRPEPPPPVEVEETPEDDDCAGAGSIIHQRGQVL
jgi:hypothetical protein